MCCTESRITSDINENEINIPGYRTIRSDAKNRHSGGVTLYLQQQVKFRVLYNKVFEHNNILIVDVIDSECRGIWIVVYHSPNYSHADFINELEIATDSIIHLQRNIYITGDFNINVHSNTNCEVYKQRLARFCNNYSFKQLVKKFTRITNSSKTIIDHFYTNDTNCSVEVSSNDCIADHKSLIMNKRKVVRRYDYKNIIDRRLCTHDNIVSRIIENKRNAPNYTSVNQMAESVKMIIEKSVNDLVRPKTICLAYSKRWYNAELMMLRAQKDLAHMRAQFIDDDESWLQYRQIRNKYNRLTNKCRNEELKQTIITCQGDQKKLWKAIKDQTNNRSNVPDCITIEGRNLVESKIIAKELNMFFIQSIIQLNRSIAYVPINLPSINFPVESWSDFQLTNECEINKLLKNIRSMSGVNNVNKSVIESSMTVLGKQIVDLFNESLQTGIFPAAFKCTVVSPIPKMRDTNKANEMRPINTPEVLDKLLQTVVKNQLQKHIENNNLISQYQSAYREKFSCETALNLIVAKWKRKIYKKQMIVVVFLDLSRAFETIDRFILIEVLRQCGLTGNVLKWFVSFLTDRKQKTRFKDALSDELCIELGVPQGTPLSSLLFILYLNPIIRIIINCHLNLFADDMLLWIAANTFEEAIRKINDELKRIFNFLNMMKLKLNIDKTKCMFIGGESNLTVVLDGKIIEKVDEMKYLGVIVDKKLNFRANTEYISKKISKKVAMLRRLKNRLDTETRLVLFKSIIAPHYDYCSTILFLATNQEIDQLQKLQNRAMRIILNAGPLEHIKDMLNKCNLLSVKQRIYFNVLKFMFKIKRNLLPEYLTALFQTTSQLQPYQLRNNDHFRPPQYLSQQAQNTLEYKGAIEFNNMLESVDIMCSVERFNQNLIVYVKDSF